jgi:dTDP-4-dehydrorhamnose 3,5-epimerase
LKVTPTKLPGVLVVEPDVHVDERGFFVETFQIRRYLDAAGITLPFVQDNLARSRRGVLRGLHFQRQQPQGRLVRVSRGEVFDVAADIDPKSPTFGQWVGTVLSDQEHRQVWIPPGYAHGYLVLSDVADFEYKCTDYRHIPSEAGVAWNDPDLAIDWPLDDPTLSARDRALPTLAELTRGR